MQLEDYFEFEKFQTPFGEAERIRIKGHRIAIDFVINDWRAGYLPEQIVANYPTLNLEKVFATLTYYLQNKDRVEAYIKRGDEIGEAYYQDYLKNEPPEVVKRLRALAAEKHQQVLRK
ncbi:MAG: DUF433 domain-containing protein [Planctomycetia bacterium]|nr:DUF433 domain-containing protein [Planctomycetia bacterium]